MDKQQIISTGGSVIYCKDGIEFLQNSKNIIIYLKTNFEILKKRTENFTNRGIVFNGLTPIELFNERDILYKKYADISIDTTGLDVNFICNMLRFCF